MQRHATSYKRHLFNAMDVSSNHAVGDFFFQNSVRLFMVTFFRLVYNQYFSFLQMCVIIAHFTCIMCKMACKAINGIYGVQSYKCDKDVYPTHIYISPFIRLTSLCNEDSIKTQFYKVKLALLVAFINFVFSVLCASHCDKVF